MRVGIATVLVASISGPAWAAQVCRIDIRYDKAAKSSVEVLGATLAQMQAKGCKEGDVLAWSATAGSGDPLAASASLCDYSKAIAASGNGFTCVLHEPRNFR